MLGNQAQVAGIGTVKIPVRRHPRQFGPGAHTTMVLKDVLHVPTSLCNILCLDSDYELRTWFRPTSRDEWVKGWITDKQDQTVGYFDADHRLWSIKLSEPPYGPVVGLSKLTGGERLMVNAFWSGSERQRWKEHQAHKAHQLSRQLKDITPPKANANGSSGNPSTSSAPYTQKAQLSRQQKDATLPDATANGSGSNPATSSAPYTQKAQLSQQQKDVTPPNANANGSGGNPSTSSAPYTQKAQLSRQQKDVTPPNANANGSGGNPATSSAPSTQNAQLSQQQKDVTPPNANANAKGSGGKPPTLDAPPYTQEEKDWLKKNYSGEFMFMRRHGLKHRRKEDHEEGRRIARAMMRADEERPKTLLKAPSQNPRRNQRRNERKRQARVAKAWAKHVAGG
jgi:hypothetical protein